MSRRLTLPLLLLLLTLSACRGWDSEVDLGTFNAEEKESFCAYEYDAFGGRAETNTCQVNTAGGTIGVVIEVEAKDEFINRCVMGEWPSGCKASVREACADAVEEAGDVCYSQVHDACLTYANCLIPTE